MGNGVPNPNFGAKDRGTDTRLTRSPPDEELPEDFYRIAGDTPNVSVSRLQPAILFPRPSWNDRCAAGDDAAPPSLTRMTFDKGVVDRFGSAKTNAARVISLPTRQQIQAELARFDADYRKMLADAGMTEQEFGIIAQYIRETEKLNARLKSQNKPPIQLSDTDLEQRILATRPQKASRFPGMIDPRGYNIGVFPRTEIATEFLATGITEFVRALLSDPALLFSLFLDFLPVIGEIKGLVEAIIGRDLITGDELPTWARVLGAATAAIPAAQVGWKIARLSTKVARRTASLAAKALAPIALVVAFGHHTPAEALRLLKYTAELDETALKLAYKEAAAARGALPATRLQEKAAQDLSKLLVAEDVAELERAAAGKAAKPVPDAAAPAPPAKKLPEMPDTLPAGAGGTGSAGRKPKGKPKPKPKPKRIPPVEGHAAYKVLEKVIKHKKLLSDSFMASEAGEFQLAVTGVRYEYVGMLQKGITEKLKKGGTVAMDGLRKSETDASKLDIVDAKWGDLNNQIAEKYGDELDRADIEAIMRSGHVLGYDGKLDHLRRLATFALENAKQIGRIKLLCNNETLVYIYYMIKEALPKQLSSIIDAEVVRL
jgi:hypothetical protein